MVAQRFYLRLLINSMMLSNLYLFIGQSSLVTCLVKSFALFYLLTYFFIWGGVLFIIDLLIFSIYSGYQNFVRYMFGEYFFVDWLVNFCNNGF